MKILKNTFFALFFTVVTAQLVAPSSSFSQPQESEASKWLATNKIVSPEVQRLSAILETVRRGLEKYGITEVYFGGGGVRVLFDHIYFGKPLVVRDVDILAVAGRPVTPELCNQIGVSTQDEVIGKFSAPDVRPRPRANTALPIPARYAHNAGYGFFWRAKEEIVDLSIYHTQHDLSLNGIFDVDTLQIRLVPEMTLADQVADLFQKQSYADLVKNGFVVDEFGGYENWHKKIIKIVHEDNILSEPIEHSIRVLRSYAKIGLGYYPNEVARWLKGKIAVSSGTNRGQVARNITKVLEDTLVASELKALQQVGTLKHWSPSFDQLIASINEAELATLLMNAPKVDGGKAPAVANGRLYALFMKINPVDRLELTMDLLKVESVLMGKWQNEALVDIFTHAANIDVSEAVVAQLRASELTKVPLVTEVIRINRSASLTAAQKQKFYYRSILRRIPEMNRQSFIELNPALFANMGADEIAELLKISKLERVAFMSGVFNPIHLGHLDVMTRGIQEAVLDRLVWMPTPATNHNEKPIEWEHRVEMGKLALGNIPEVEVVSQDYKPFLEQSTGDAIRKLSESLPEGTPLIHLLGADSIERALEKGHTTSYLQVPSREVWVALRPPYPMPPIPAELASRVFVFNPMSAAPQFGEQNRSSTMVRNYRAEGKSILGLVHPKVMEYIEQHNLYAPVAAAAVSPCDEALDP